MNLTKLFETQRILDERIENEHPRVEGEDRLAKKILALQVELGECANEWRGFKFWSKYQQPRTESKVICHACNGKGNFTIDIYTNKKEMCGYCEGTGFQENRNPLLEEYVDCLHFILSIGLEYEIKATDLTHLEIETEDSIELQFIIMNVLLTEIYLTPKEHVKNDYRDCFHLFIGLGEMLGFTWEQIEQAYYEKNEINHTRQETGY